MEGTEKREILYRDQDLARARKGIPEEEIDPEVEV